MFGMLGVFAEFERETIRERVNANLARTVAKGTRLGQPRIPAARKAEIHKALRSDAGIRKVAHEHKAGVGALPRIKARMERVMASERHPGPCDSAREP